MKSKRLLTAGVLLSLSLCAVASTARAADAPRIIRPRMFLSLWQQSGTWSPTAKKMVWNLSAWVPSIKFPVTGPVTGGSQWIVEFTKPGGAPWFSMNCPTEEIGEDRWITVETPRDTSEAMERKATNGTGLFGFKIRLKNELNGTNNVLYTGKYKVGKVSRYNGTAVMKNQYDFYIDHDWAMPFGYLWWDDDAQPALQAAMWFKGQGLNNLAGYVFYKGKQIASTKEMGSAGDPEFEADTIDNKPGDPAWSLCRFTWYKIRNSKGDDSNPNWYFIDKNPGAYEIKILRSGKLARQLNFTVGADGQIVGNDLSSVTKLNTARIVLPVKVLGTTDGAWNEQAWKTEAFYGNPVSGFTAAQ